MGQLRPSTKRQPRPGAAPVSPVAEPQTRDGLGFLADWLERQLYPPTPTSGEEKRVGVWLRGLALPHTLWTTGELFSIYRKAHPKTILDSRVTFPRALRRAGCKSVWNGKPVRCFDGLHALVAVGRGAEKLAAPRVIARRYNAERNAPRLAN